MRRKQKKEYLIIIDEKIYRHIIKQNKNKHLEAGYYMVGLFTDKIAYVYDVMEFPYIDRSGISVASDPSKLGKVFTALPLGLRIIGTMHKHPDKLGSKYSAIDEATYLRWSKRGIFIHVIFSKAGDDISAYIVDRGKIRKIPYIIKDLSEEPLQKFTLSFSFDLDVYFHPKEPLLILLNTIERSIMAALAKRIFPIMVNDKKPNTQISKIPSISFRKKAVIRVLSHRQTYFSYEFVYPEKARFGDIKGEIIEILNLPDNTEFFTRDGAISDNTTLSELNGKTIFPSKTLDMVIRNIVRNEIEIMKADIAESINSLRENIRDIIREELARILTNFKLLSDDENATTTDQ